VTLTAVPGLQVGHAQVSGGGSGCTVVLGPFRAVVEVTGMATGTRELGTLAEEHIVPTADAIVLSGGSAYGLAAAHGAVAWLAERGRGYPTGADVVPIVPAAILYDLAADRARPDASTGYAACEAASDAPVPEGRVGAGTGATVGKIAGTSMPGGIGTASVRIGGVTVGALAEPFDLSLAAISKHLGILARAGLRHELKAVAARQDRAVHPGQRAARLSVERGEARWCFEQDATIPGNCVGQEKPQAVALAPGPGSQIVGTPVIGPRKSRVGVKPRQRLADAFIRLHARRTHRQRRRPGRVILCDPFQPFGILGDYFRYLLRRQDIG